MAKLEWDKTGERLYETGVKNGVLYLLDNSGKYDNGVAWNGLTSVSENPSGAEATALWADDVKYLNLLSTEQFACTIEAYMYPDEFAQCDGSAMLGGNIAGVYVGQQARKTFGFCYRTAIGNDVDNAAHGYKLHLVYGCVASPSSKSYSTQNDSPEAITFSWEVNTTPVEVGDGLKPTATVTIDSTVVEAEKLAALEAILYGGESTNARMPLPAELKTIFA